MLKGVSSKSMADPVAGTSSKGTAKGDFYAMPEELVFVVSPGQTNAVTRFMAVRSVSGKPVKVTDVVLPCPGKFELSEVHGTSECLIRLSGVLPTPEIDGKAVKIRLQDGITLPVPLILRSLPRIGE